MLHRQNYNTALHFPGANELKGKVIVDNVVLFSFCKLSKMLRDNCRVWANKQDWRDVFTVKYHGH